MDEVTIEKLLEKTATLVAATAFSNVEEFLQENSLSEIEAKNRKLLNHVLKLEQECDDERIKMKDVKYEYEKSQQESKKYEELKSKIAHLVKEKKQLLERRRKIEAELAANDMTMEQYEEMKNSLKLAESVLITDQ